MAVLVDNEPIVSKKVRDRLEKRPRILQVLCQHRSDDSLVLTSCTRLSDVKGIFDLKSYPVCVGGESEKAVCNSNRRRTDVDAFKPYVRSLFAASSPRTPCPEAISITLGARRE